MKVESVQNVNSSYQSKGNAGVSAQTSVSSSAQTGGSTSQDSSPKQAVDVSSDGIVLTGTGREEGQASSEQIRQAVDKINKNTSNQEAIFGIHDATNRVTIKIVDKETKEVIREYPPEKTLDMIAKVWEMAGLMVDERR